MVLGCPVRTVDFPGIDQPMLVVSFPGGGHLSVEFTDEAPDDERPRLGAWLELRADDPAAVLRAALGAGLTEVKHPDHPYYFDSWRPGFHRRPDELNTADECEPSDLWRRNRVAARSVREAS
jgi:hypothetical protein